MTALNAPAVEYYTLDVPPVVFTDPNANVSELVRWEVGRLMNKPLDDVETSHWLLPKTKVSAPTAIGVAVQQDVVAQTIKTCRHVGLDCFCVDAGAAALSRFGMLLRQWRPDEVWGLIDIGFSQAQLVLCVEGVPVLVRRVSSGGGVWTKLIADSLQLSVKAAEVQKREHGIALTSRGVRPGLDPVPSKEVASILLAALRTELRDLAAEVKRSYDHVLSCYPHLHTSDLVLVGGVAAMKNLPEYVSQMLGISVRRASDYLSGEDCRICYASGKQRRFEVLALAIGLAVAC